MASQKRGQRPAARPSAPLIVACTAGAVLVGAGALFARLRFCRCEEKPPVMRGLRMRSDELPAYHNAWSG